MPRLRAPWHLCSVSHDERKVIMHNVPNGGPAMDATIGARPAYNGSGEQGYPVGRHRASDQPGHPDPVRAPGPANPGHRARSHLNTARQWWLNTQPYTGRTPTDDEVLEAYAARMSAGCRHGR